MSDAVENNGNSAFWDDLDRDMQDPEFRHHFLLQSERIAAIDEIMNQLDTIREDLGVSKAGLARATERQPATVRRLFTAPQVNPELGVVAELAAALGYRVKLVPMSAAERKRVAEPLRDLVDA